MALGVLRNSVVEVRDGLQGHAELADEGLGQEGIGGDDALIGGQRRSALDGLDALIDDVGVADMVRPEEALQGGAARELCGLEGWPLGEKIAEDGRVFVVKPLQDMRKVVFQGAAETVRDAHFVAHEAAAMFDELFEGAHRRALGFQRRERIAMFEQEFELELSVGGIVLGMAGCEGFTVSCEREGIDGKEHEEVVLAQRIDEGAFVEFETDGNRLSLEALAQGTHPLIDGFWRVYKDTELACLRASRLQADIVFGNSPVDADERRKCIRR